jgi:putative resolvase
MLLKHWAKKQGISYRTALRWYHGGTMPVRAWQNMPRGSILVTDAELRDANNCGVHLYSRVSSHDQKEDLDRQLKRLRDYAAAKGWDILSETKEIGSGLNGKRPKLQKLLEQPDGAICVEHEDRLSRFGVPYIRAAMRAANRELYVINATEQKNELVQDFIDVITSMCARIYGKRSAKNKAKRAIEACSRED